MSEETLIDIIEQQMHSDDANRKQQSTKLVKAFENSKDQDSIDQFLIALCGWSFDTLERIGRTSLLPISHAKAIRLWTNGNDQIFRLYHDDTEGLIENEEELAKAIEAGIDLGIEGE